MKFSLRKNGRLEIFDNGANCALQGTVLWDGAEEAEVSRWTEAELREDGVERLGTDL